MKTLFYAAPPQSLDFILREGILCPSEVRRRIAAGTLDQEVLGVSYDGVDTSNFPAYVSLVSDSRTLKQVASSMSFSRFGTDTADFRAIVYHVSPDIRSHAGFMDEASAKGMNRDIYHSEVLYLGNIPREFIDDEQTCVRPMCFY